VNPESRTPNPDSGAIRYHGDSLAFTVPIGEIGCKGCRDRHIPLGTLPDMRLSTLQAPQLAWRRHGGRRNELGQRGRHIWRIPVRLVDDGRTHRSRNTEQQRCNAEVPGEHHVGPTTSGSTPGCEREIAEPSRGGRSAGRRALNPESLQRRQPVIVERVPRRLLGVRPHDQLHIMAPLGQRITRLHCLDPVRALQGETDVREVEDAEHAGRQRGSCCGAAAGL
jgi:hypothetical protein